jgi:putative oxidoreductase
MNDVRNVRLGSAILRISLGFMFIAHSLLLKVHTYGMEGTVQFFASLGLPEFTAWLTMLGEAIGGILLVLGVGTRLVAFGLIPVLAGALWVHAGNGWVFSAPNGGWEYPLFLIVVSLVVGLQHANSWRPGLFSQAINAASD